jgi:hypothetical protein
MHRNLTINLLNNHLTENSVEQEEKMKMLDFIAHEPNCFERSCQVSEESHNLKWVEREDQLPDNYGIKRMFQKWKRLKNNA